MSAVRYAPDGKPPSIQQAPGEVPCRLFYEAHCTHEPSGARRRVTGIRNGVVHFSQVIKLADGRTIYWATAAECNEWDVRRGGAAWFHWLSAMARRGRSSVLGSLLAVTAWLSCERLPPMCSPGATPICVCTEQHGRVTCTWHCNVRVARGPA